MKHLKTFEFLFSSRKNNRDEKETELRKRRIELKDLYNDFTDILKSNVALQGTDEIYITTVDEMVNLLKEKGQNITVDELSDLLDEWYPLLDMDDAWWIRCDRQTGTIEAQSPYSRKGFAYEG